MKIFSSFLTGVLLLSTMATASFTRRLGARKLVEAEDPSSVLEGQYIIIFDSNVSNVTAKAAQLFSPQQISFEYDNAAFKGVSIRSVTKTLLRKLLTDPQIILIEPEIAMTYSTIGIKNTQLNSTYNLDRLDQDFLPLDGTYKHRSDGGQGVTVYILDSGLRLTHVDFEGRAICGFDATLGIESDIPCEDVRGHGTPVAGLIGGKLAGVAKKVSLVSVKVVTDPSNGPLELGRVLAGLQYILEQKTLNPSKPMVINISITGGRSRPMDTMIKKLLEVGVTVVTSAGNDGDNACKYSPAGTPGVITVGASDDLDQVQWWSNNGTCVDLYAPGVNIISSRKKNDTYYGADEGTSMSAPMAAGAAALYLQITPTLTPAQVFTLMVKDSIKNRLLPGPAGGFEPDNFDFTVYISKNRLLHTGIFTDDKTTRKYPTCPYTGNKLPLCTSEGWI